MPTRAEARPGHIGLYSQEASRSWTDDLPVCRLSGVGLSTNQIYREDGQRREEHEFEDRSSHFRLDENTFFYGVFDGHEGSRAAHFAAEHMPAEVLLGQLRDKTTDKDVKEVLHQAFIAIEKGFFDSIGDLLAEKANLQIEMPKGLNPYETYTKYPDIVTKIQQLNADISGGTTAVVALIFNDRIYVANVGDSRALLCRADKDKVLGVTQLSVDHDLHNEDELLRLSHLGLDVNRFRRSMSTKLGNQYNTRCIGNYMVKGEYKDFDSLKDATAEPVIAEPEVHGGIQIDDTFSFLLLMSDGLYKALEEATGTEQANWDVARMVAEQFAEQSTLTGVAQAVVDKVVRLHHDSYMSGSGTCQKRDDITLLVRNVHCNMPKAMSSPQPRVQFNPDIRYVIPANDPSLFQQSGYGGGGGAESSVDTAESSVDTAESAETTESNATTTTGPTRSSQANTSSTDSEERFFRRPTNQLLLDEEGRIEPYIDFGGYYRALAEARALRAAAAAGGLDGGDAGERR